MRVFHLWIQENLGWTSSTVFLELKARSKNYTLQKTPASALGLPYPDVTNLLEPGGTNL